MKKEDSLTQLDKNNIKEMFDDFKKELKENDKLVKEEINTNDRLDMAKEFADFIKKNNCKIKGGKNGK